MPKNLCVFAHQRSICKKDDNFQYLTYFIKFSQKLNNPIGKMAIEGKDYGQLDGKRCDEDGQ